MFEALTASGITSRAFETGIVSLQTWNPRDFTKDKHRTVDDRPYGGGPGMVMMAAADEAELVHMVATAVAINDRPSALRYPRGNGFGVELPDTGEILQIGKGRVLREGTKVALLSYGPRLKECRKAADDLAARGGPTPGAPKTARTCGWTSATSTIVRRMRSQRIRCRPRISTSHATRSIRPRERERASTSEATSRVPLRTMSSLP